MADEQDATLYATREAADITGTEFLLGPVSATLAAAGAKFPITLFPRYDASGNVGIGTTSPTADLDVRSTLDVGGSAVDGTIGIVRSAGQRTGRIKWDTAGNALEFHHDNGGAHNWFRNGTKIMILDTANKLTPATSGGSSLGSASLPWNTPYFTVAPVITSDARYKQWARYGLSDAEYQAGLELRGKFGWFKRNESIETKGDDARLHYGVRVQEVWDVFVEYSLAPERKNDGSQEYFPYSFLSHAVWDAVTEPVLVDGEIVENGENIVITEAGNKFLLRLEMLNAFMGSVRDRRQDELEQRIEQLEA